MTPADRDPRIDPAPGDVLDNGHTIRTVRTRTVSRLGTPGVEFTATGRGTPSRRRMLRVRLAWIVQWRRWAADAAVVSMGAP